MKDRRSVEKNLAGMEVASTLSAIQKKVVELQKTGGERFVVAKDRTTKVAGATKDKAFKIASDRRVQVTAASAAGGGAAVGAGGALAGLVAGGAIGASIGILPALFTLGLSIPLGAALGSGCGLVVGGAAGTASGVATGGAVGYGVFTKRAEIKKATMDMRAKIMAGIKKGREVSVYCIAVSYAHTTNKSIMVKSRVRSAVESIKQSIEPRFGAAVRKTAAAIVATKQKTREVASQKVVQVTTASAAGGAVVGGTGGAATGLLAGGALGAAIGVVPAIFTLGLSIPAFAVLGGGCGLAAGTAVGGTAGATVGGASGYGIYTKREAIGAKVDQTATYVRNTTAQGAGYLRTKLSGAGGSSK